jgi:HEPN domain-containing protein
MDIEQHLSMWIKSSADNYKSMLNMFKAGEYMWSLFVGHLVLEKLLKAYYIKVIDNNVPYVHDLHKLAIRCGLELTESQKDSLRYITLFNIEARYEEYKGDFYKKCAREFAEKNINIIKELRDWLMQKIEQ